jgi:hypothetical protein
MKPEALPAKDMMMEALIATRALKTYINREFLCDVATEKVVSNKSL